MIQKKKYKNKYKYTYRYKNKKQILSPYQRILKKHRIYLKKTKKKKSNIKYLYFNKKLKKGIFLKLPNIKEISYPYILNLKLISQYLKKK